MPSPCRRAWPRLAVLAVSAATAMAAVAAPVGAAAAAPSPTTRVPPSAIMPLPALHPRASASTSPPHLEYWGGKVISSVQVVEVLYGPGTYEAEVTASPSTYPSVGSFYRGITQSPYIDWLSEYNTTITAQGGIPGTNQTIGRGSFLSQVQISPSAADAPSTANGMTVTDTQIQRELKLQIASTTLPAPGPNVLYAIHFPLGVTISMADGSGATVYSGVGFCAYHGTTSAPEAYYSVLPDFDTGGMTQCGTGTEFQRLTTISSHELVEAITDPEVGNAAALAPPLGWYDQANNQEAADLCESLNDQASMVGGDGHTYSVQVAWSNLQNACVDRPAPTPLRTLGVGQPSVAVTPNGSQQLVMWRGGNADLFEAWYQASGWNGPIDVSAAALGGAQLASAPSLAITPDGSQQLVFWRGGNGHLYEAWYQNGWNGPVDVTSSYLPGAQLASVPSVTVTPDGSQQLVFWQGGGGHLYEAWYQNGWNGPVDVTSSYLPGAQLASAPSVALTPNGSQQLVFWQGGGGHLYEAWFQNGWNGPVDVTSSYLPGAQLASSPSVALTPNGSQQLVFWQGGNGHVYEAWFQNGWNGPVDVTSSYLPGAQLASAPSVAVTPDGSQQLLFWQGPGSYLWEGWYQSGWHGPIEYS
ncbi:MAG: PLL family lectin [Candidatus Dormibacteria bacterium]